MRQKLTGLINIKKTQTRTLKCSDFILSSHSTSILSDHYKAQRFAVDDYAWDPWMCIIIGQDFDFKTQIGRREIYFCIMGKPCASHN